MNIFTLFGTIALKGASEAETQLKGLEGFAKKNEKAFKAAGIAMTAAGAAITGALAYATKAALDEQVGINRLDVALKNAGRSYAGLKSEIEAAMAATQAKTNYGDGEQREALTALIGVTGTYQGALEQLRLATDLAAAKNMDLTSAATLVGRVAMGNTALLSRYGIQVKEGATATEIMADMQERFAGAAAGAANPLIQLKNTVGDLAEDVGSVLVPVLRSAVDIIKPVIAQVRNWIQANPELTKGIVVLGGALGLLMGAVIGPMLIALPKLISGFVAFRNTVLAVRLATIEYTVIALASIAAIYGIINLVRSLKGEAYAGTGIGDTVFGQIKQDIASLMGKLGELLPASTAAIEEATYQGKAGFDNMSDGISGTTQKLEEFNQKAEEVREQERRLALTFVDLWQRLTYNETAAGKLNLTMEDVYQALYKLGVGQQEIGYMFEAFGMCTDAVGLVLQRYGLTAEEAARLVGKLTEATDQQTVALRRQAAAARDAGVAITPGGPTSYQQDILNAAMSNQIWRSSAEYTSFMEAWNKAPGQGNPLMVEWYSRWAKRAGNWAYILPGMAHGGMIEEPTMLTRLRDMKPYAVAGERGPERVTATKGYQTANIYVLLNGREILKALGQPLVDLIRLQTGIRIS